MTAIVLEGLTKYYGSRRGIEDLDLTVQEGEVLGYLGPNGAGKTTTLRLLMGYLRPTRGRATVLGREPFREAVALRRRLGYVAGEPALYDTMTGEELLTLLGRLHGMAEPALRQRIRQLGERLRVSSLRQTIRTLSHGNKQKLVLLQALLSDPDLLLLDEPTQGLDPLMRREFHLLLEEERRQGRTVFLSTHDLSEAERLCDRVGILREGRLVAVEPVAELQGRRRRRMEVRFHQPVAREALILPGVEILSWQERYAVLLVQGAVGPLLGRLATLGVEDLIYPEATLEEAFLQYYPTPEAS